MPVFIFGPKLFAQSFAWRAEYRFFSNLISRFSGGIARNCYSPNLVNIIVHVFILRFSNYRKVWSIDFNHSKISMQIRILEYRIYAALRSDADVNWNEGINFHFKSGNKIFIFDYSKPAAGSGRGETKGLAATLRMEMRVGHVFRFFVKIAQTHLRLHYELQVEMWILVTIQQSGNRMALWVMPRVHLQICARRC